jgi:hypothetical protein
MLTAGITAQVNESAAASTADREQRLSRLWQLPPARVAAERMPCYIVSHDQPDVLVMTASGVSRDAR